MAMRVAYVHIAGRSDASVGKRTSGIAWGIFICIDFGKDTVEKSEIVTETVQEWKVHVPINEVDVAERIGVLACAYRMLVIKNVILKKIATLTKNAESVMLSSIVLWTDRQSLVRTLGSCDAFCAVSGMLERAYELPVNTGVEVRWESRESAFMKGIDKTAREAIRNTVFPMCCVFPQEFINIINKNLRVRDQIVQMQQANLEEIREASRRAMNGWDLVVGRLIRTTKGVPGIWPLWTRSKECYIAAVKMLAAVKLTRSLCPRRV